MLEFGILRTVDGPKTLRLNLFNSGSRAVLITVSSVFFWRFDPWSHIARVITDLKVSVPKKITPDLSKQKTETDFSFVKHCLIVYGKICVCRVSLWLHLMTRLTWSFEDLWNYLPMSCRQLQWHSFLLPVGVKSLDFEWNCQVFSWCLLHLFAGWLRYFCVVFSTKGNPSKTIQWQNHCSCKKRQHETRYTVPSKCAARVSLDVPDWKGVNFDAVLKFKYRYCQIPFSFRTLHVNKTNTRFFTGSPPHQNETRKIPVTSTFNMTIVVYNITAPADVSHLFTVSFKCHFVAKNFSWNGVIRNFCSRCTSLLFDRNFSEVWHLVKIICLGVTLPISTKMVPTEVPIQNGLRLEMGFEYMIKIWNRVRM